MTVLRRSESSEYREKISEIDDMLENGGLAPARMYSDAATEILETAEKLIEYAEVRDDVTESLESSEIDQSRILDEIDDTVDQGEDYEAIIDQAVEDHCEDSGAEIRQVLENYAEVRESVRQRFN